MKKIDCAQAQKELSTFVGESVYVHSEATSFVFVRNFRVRLEEAFIAGENTYRVALRLEGRGWLRMEAFFVSF